MENLDNLNNSEAIQQTILLFDDDPLFSSIMLKTAKKMNINLKVCHSLNEFVEEVSYCSPDLSIIDYYLGNYNGMEIAEVVGDLPVILTSRKSDCAQMDGEWPSCILGFVHKKYGPRVLLQTAQNFMTQGIT